MSYLTSTEFPFSHIIICFALQDFPIFIIPLIKIISLIVQSLHGNSWLISVQ